jgi:hypothetical protein
MIQMIPTISAKTSRPDNQIARNKTLLLKKKYARPFSPKRAAPPRTQATTPSLDISRRRSISAAARHHQHVPNAGSHPAIINRTS